MTNLSNVLGPYTRKDWKEMLLIKEIIVIDSERNTAGRYDDALRMNKSLLTEYLTKKAA